MTRQMARITRMTITLSFLVSMPALALPADKASYLITLHTDNTAGDGEFTGKPVPIKPYFDQVYSYRWPAHRDLVLLIVVI